MNSLFLNTIFSHISTFIVDELGLTTASYYRDVSYIWENTASRLYLSVDVSCIDINCNKTGSSEVSGSMFIFFTHLFRAYIAGKQSRDFKHRNPCVVKQLRWNSHVKEKTTCILNKAVK